MASSDDEMDLSADEDEDEDEDDRHDPLLAGPQTVISSDRKATATGISPEASMPRQRWASAPELEELAGELLGTREQVLACLVLQGAYRQRLSSRPHDRVSERRRVACR